MAAHSHTSQGRKPAIYSVDADQLLRAVGLDPTLGEHGYALGPQTRTDAHQLPTRTKTSADSLNLRGDASVLDEPGRPDSPSVAVPDMGFVPQVLSATQHKIAAAQKRFWSFVLPDGHLLEPRRREVLVKSALATMLPPQSAAVPLQQAQQAMQQFLPGKPMVAGQGVRPTGLDGPVDTSATAMPGTPGHAATNVIDRMGGLDPRGATVDGNNAAGVAKGFKMASLGSPEWFHEILAGLLGQPKAAQAARGRAKEGSEVKRLWRSSQLFEKVAAMSNGCETAHSGLTEKAGVALPFRPVNADPDFISRNWSWHVGEKARLAAARPPAGKPALAGSLGAAPGPAAAGSPAPKPAPAPIPTSSPSLSSFAMRTPGSPSLRLASVPNMLGD